MNFSEPLGPSTVARLRLCRPGENLLWAAYGEVFYYDVGGLDRHGEPRRSALGRGVRAFGRGTADLAEYAVSDIVFGGFVDESTDRPPPPDVIAFGKAPDCLVRRAMCRLPPVGTLGHRLWVLTSDRLAVLEPPVVEERPKTENRSMLKKAAGFGKELFEVSKGIADIVTDRAKKTYGPNTEGVPVTPWELSLAAELPRTRIAGVALTQRRAKLRSRPCLRVSLVDGSGLDFLLQTEEPAVFEWMLTLTNGGGGR